MGQTLKIIVRSPGKLPEDWKTDDRITTITASINEVSVAEMRGYLDGCQAVASCLGHNLTLKGLFGKPRKLVRDAIRLSCLAIQEIQPEAPIKVVLMNTAGNSNRDLQEPTSLGHRLVIGLIRLLLPPHRDNEQAADYLRIQVGQDNPFIQWVAVRPDSLINETQVSPYEAFPSPTRSPIFNPGKTSRINVGHFMAKLLTDSELWQQWKGQMPVVYNN